MAYLLETIERLEERTKKVRRNRQGRAKLKRQMDQDRARRNRKRSKAKRGRAHALGPAVQKEIDDAVKTAREGADEVTDMGMWEKLRRSRSMEQFFAGFVKETLTKVMREISTLPEVQEIYLQSESNNYPEDSLTELKCHLVVELPSDGANAAVGRVMRAAKSIPQGEKLKVEDGVRLGSGGADGDLVCGI